jgi:hypothetical protein
MENPRSSQLCNIVCADFMQAAETTPGVVAIVGRPIFAYGRSHQIFGRDV